MEKSIQWKYLGSKTIVAQVPGGMVIKTWEEAGETGIACALVFIPGRDSHELTAQADWIKENMQSD